MVRFPCFSLPSHHQKSKKVHKLGATMHSSSQEMTQGRSVLSVSTLNLLQKVHKLGATMHSSSQEMTQGAGSTKPKSDDNNHSNNSTEQLTSPSSREDCWKSGNLNTDLCQEHSEECHLRMHMKKSQSFGCIVDKARGFSGGDITDDDDSHEKNMMRMNGSFNDITSAELYVPGNVESSLYDLHEGHDLVQPLDKISDNVHHETLFSVEAFLQFDGEHADIDEQSVDHVVGSGFFSSDIPPALARSQSVNDLRVDTASSTEDVLTGEVLGPRSRSFENLRLPNREGSVFHVEDEKAHLLSNTSGKLSEVPERDEQFWCRRFDSDGKSTDGYDPHNYNMVGNTGNELETDDAKLKNLQQEPFILNCDELNPKEFNARRIQEWISKIEEGDCIVEEPGESSGSFSSKEPQVGADVPSVAITKPDARSHLGMEVAYNYISSLTATSSTAHMANLGLVAVPFLSAFVGLRVLNLSDNGIVRITAGALPRGLHMLNLSKNNIAVIEGLRDLTRLRVLDLSYNRIIRIGHGLASCSSLKELYLAGNKIREVEGLHRLLKLNILDLRSNKISTAKDLRQLAANYGSLQAINLDGNPAQRNVGDEQLKKHLLSLHPNLAHYNKQSLRVSSMKEISDRPSRSAAHHFDRSTRTENKLTRRGSHGSALHKLSLNPIRSRQSKSRSIESRHMHLPPIASKLLNLQSEDDKKSTSLQSSNLIRRIRSEGNIS